MAKIRLLGAKYTLHIKLHMHASCDLYIKFVLVHCQSRDVRTWTLAARDDLQVFQCDVQQRILCLWVVVKWITGLERSLRIGCLVHTHVSQTYRHSASLWTIKSQYGLLHLCIDYNDVTKLVKRRM